MYQKKLGDDIRCPLEYGLDIFGGRWKSRILCMLDQFDSVRYSALKAEMQNITDAVLSAMLKELVRTDMIVRRSYDEIPPRVEYSLTEKGRSVIPILHGICRWSKQYYTPEDESRLPRYCADCYFFKDPDIAEGKQE